MSALLPRQDDFLRIPVYFGSANGDPAIFIVKVPDFKAWDLYDRTRTRTPVTRQGKDTSIVVEVDHDADFKIIYDNLVGLDNVTVREEQEGDATKDVPHDEAYRKRNPGWKDDIPPVYLRRAAQFFWQAGINPARDAEKK